MTRAVAVGLLVVAMTVASCSGEPSTCERLAHRLGEIDATPVATGQSWDDVALGVERQGVLDSMGAAGCPRPRSGLGSLDGSISGA